MPYFDFAWTDEIIDHIAQHGVSPEDFEYVACNPERQGFSQSSGRPAAWGYLPDGRYIIVIYEEVDSITLLPVTAYEVPEP